MIPQKKYLVYTIILLPILIFYGFGWSYGINVPWLDDIETIPYFFVQFLDAPTWVEQIKLFLRPNNEHRILSSHLIVYLHYLLTGQINFKTLLIIGNLTVLGIFLLIARAYLRNGGLRTMLIPVTFVIFNLQYYTMTFMTIMSLQYQLIICEVFLSLYLLSKPQKWAFGTAMAAALLGTFSMGNGMMVWPTGVLMLVLLTDWKRLKIWTIVGVLAICLYFSGYNFVQGNDEGFTYFFQHPFKVIVGFFAFAGGIWDWFPRTAFEKRMILPVLGGLFISAFFVFYSLGVLSKSIKLARWLPQKTVAYYHQMLYFQRLNVNWGAFWIGCFVYLLINSALVVFFRTRFDYKLVLWATYKIYPATLMALTMMLSLQIASRRRANILYLFFMVTAFCSWFSSYWYFVPQVSQDRKQRLAFALNQNRDAVGLGAEKNSAFATFIVNTLRDTRQKGVYQLPSPLIDAQEKNLEKIMRDSTQQKKQIEVAIDMQANTVQLLNNTLSYTDSKEQGAFVTLTSPKYFYVFSAIPNGAANGFMASCPKGVLYNDTYQIGVWVVQKNGNRLYSTNKTLKIE